MAVNSLEAFVPTNFSREKKTSIDNYVHVTFTSHKSNKAKPENDVLNTSHQKDKRKENAADLEKLRYEVIKYGSQGFDSTKKEASSIALTVSLGAKPPKRKYENYKELLKNKKHKIEPVVSVNQGASSKHLYVIGNKVIPAQPKIQKGKLKILDIYGKVTARNKKKNGWKKKK